ncbi:hypothetical protein ACEQ8H_002660 [Pleosporales sp. CAS-2024a]
MDSNTSTPPEMPARGSREQAMNRQVNLKMDIALLPFLSLLYLFNGFDRSNIGNAETQGFSRDIGATPDDFNAAASLFFVTFVALQPASAAVGKWAGANKWIPIMMTGWGTFTVVNAFIRGRSALIAMRLIVGAFEAGFYPTAIAYLANFYGRYDMALRIAIFYGQYAIAGAFSGSIAFGVFRWRGKRLYSWQYLLVIEEGPESAWFLNAEERRFVVRRLQNEHDNHVGYGRTPDEDSGSSATRPNRELTKRDVVEAAKDWKTWFVLVCNICASVPSQTFSVFLPLVVQGLQYSSIEANLVGYPLTKERGYHILGGIFISLIGLVVAVTSKSNRARYAGLCILLFGSYIAAPLTMAWLSGNTPSPGKRSLVLGVNGFGNAAGVIGAQLYRKRFAPEYRVPFYATLGFVAAALLGYAAYRWTLQSVNARRTARLADMTPEQVDAERRLDTRYADRKMTFLYGL